MKDLDDQDDLNSDDAQQPPLQDPAEPSAAASGDETPIAVPNKAMPKKRRRRSSLSADDDRKARIQKRRRMLNKLSDEAKAKIVEDWRAEVKTEFESRREEVLQSMPEDYKSMFGEIGFTKWSGRVYSCIILCPYQIPPSEARRTFYRNYDELNDKGRLKDLPFLIYFYGEQNVNSQYYFIPKSNFTPFDEGRNKKTHFLVLLDSKKKKESNKKLSKQDEYNLRALQEIEEDLPKDRSDRRRIDFPEEYDLLTDSELLKEYVEEGSSSSSSSINSDEDSEMNSQEESEPAASAAVNKGASKRGRKMSVKVETSKPTKINVPYKGKSVVEADEEEAANLKYALEDSDEVDDDDSRDRGWQGQDFDDEVDMDLTSNVLFKSSLTEKKKTNQGDRKTEKRQLTPLENEKREFKRCEKHYLPFVREWEKAFELRDLFALESCFDRANAIVNDCSAPFLEAYFPLLVKKTKSFLKDSTENDVLLRSIKAVGKKLQEVYDEKKKDVPPGFKAPKKKFNKDLADLRATTTGAAGAVARACVNQPEPRTARSLSPVRVAHEELEMATSSRMSDSFQSVLQRPNELKLSHLKSERKSFSLGKLKTRFESQQPISNSNQTSSQTKTSRFPLWMTEEVMNKHVDDLNRALGLDFLLDMASHFPPDKVSAESIAGSLENAVYEWAQKVCVIMGEPESGGGTSWQGATSMPTAKKPWVDLYWFRIHALITAVCGLQGIGSGTLMHLIMNGHFESAESLATISDEKLWKASNGSSFL